MIWPQSSTAGSSVVCDVDAKSTGVSTETPSGRSVIPRVILTRALSRPVNDGDGGWKD
jgi:hypothetical protein